MRRTRLPSSFKCGKGALSGTRRKTRCQTSAATALAMKFGCLLINQKDYPATELVYGGG
jgi:hypothetical protein